MGRSPELAEWNKTLELLGRGISADSLAAQLISGSDAASSRAAVRVSEALIYLRENTAVRERIREAVERLELAEDAGDRGRRQSRERIERIADRLTSAEAAAAGERALSGERIRQVVERIEGAESAEASARVISRERLRQVVERLEAAERAENTGRIISGERLRQVIERIEAVEAREAGEDAISRERIRQVIERLENTDNERRRESIITRERIRQVIERLEAAADSGSRESSLTKTRVEEVIEQIGGEDTERTRRDYRNRQAREPKPWYAPFTLALSRAFSRELLRDRTGFVRGDTNGLEGVVTPVMREKYKTLSKKFSDELLARSHHMGSTSGSVFNLLFRDERQGDTTAETRNIFNIFNNQSVKSGASQDADISSAAREYAAMAGSELSYAPTARLADAPRYTGASAEPSDDNLGALPSWARDFIRESAGKQGGTAQISTAASRRDMTALADIALSSSARQEAPDARDDDMVVWTAPGVAKTPPPVILKPNGGRSEAKAAAPPRISDAEIQRMADKVYGIIENRVTLERRRLGY
jgi:cell division protein YceG involved in septum cleavage